MKPYPWKLLLFVPAHIDRYIFSAHQLQQVLPVQVVFDLEDGCPARHREQGRENIRRYAHSADWVRLTRDEIERDEEFLPPVLSGVILPKAGPKDANETWRQPLVSIIETAEGLEHVGEVAAYSSAIIFGLGDLTTSLGSEEFGDWAAKRTLLAGKARGKPVYDSPSGSMDPSVQREWARRSHRLGFDGMVVLNPDEAKVTWEHARPTPDEMTYYRSVLDDNDAVHVVEGSIVGPPHVARARRMVQLWS
jgi:citrate lyase subunit beta/citryl-CoA lyase